MIFRFIKSNGAIIALSGVILFYVVNNLAWLYYDQLPPAWDQAAHLNLCLKFMRAAGSPLSSQSLDNLLNLSLYYPPLFYFTSIPFLVIFGFSFDAAVFTNFLYLVILVFSVYNLGRYFFGRKAGIGAVVILLLYPMVYALSRELLLDFSLLATVSLAQYAIIISKGGTDIRKSWLLGVILAISVMIKWTAGVFLFGSLVYCIFKNWPKDKKTRIEAIGALCVSTVIFLALVLPWYLKTAKGLFADEFIGAAVSSVLHPAASILNQMSFYPVQIKDALISGSLFNFTLIGLVFFIAFIRRRDFVYFILAWIIPPFLVFSLMLHKEGRYILPILPALAILTSAGINAVPVRFIRRIIWALLIAAGVWQFYAMSFGWPVPASAGNYFCHPPLRQDWKEKEILEELYSNFSDKPLKIGILVDNKYFNGNIFEFYKNFLNLPYVIDIDVADNQNSRNREKQISDYDILITKSSRRTDFTFPQRREELHALLVSNRPGQVIFGLWKEFFLPDGARAQVYVREGL